MSMGRREDAHGLVRKINNERSGHAQRDVLRRESRLTESGLKECQQGILGMQSEAVSTTKCRGRRERAAYDRGDHVT